MTTWQTLAEQANDKWYNGSLKNKRYTKFIKALPKIEKEAVVLKNLLCLVTNGGFWQWIVNGYCVSIAEVIEVLKQIRKPFLYQVTAYAGSNRALLAKKQREGGWL